MPSSRLSLRLGQLPHDVLADLAARLCSDSPALQATAEECMAAHAAPLSHELVERVLLSPDLVPSILGPLEAKEGGGGSRVLAVAGRVEGDQRNSLAPPAEAGAARLPRRAAPR